MLLRGHLRISKRGVPYLLLGNYSICYFGTNNFLRTFIDFALPTNRKFRDFKTVPELVLR